MDHKEMDWDMLQAAHLAVKLLLVCCISTQCVAEPECRQRNLEFGQSYFTLKDNGESAAVSAIRGSNNTYLGNINQYAEFFITVPNVYHGVKVDKLCAFTKNVISIDLTINKEAIPDVFGKPEHVDRMSEYVKNSPRKWQKTCFRPLGEIASLIMKFNKGRQRRVKVTKLYMKACEGDNYDFL